MKYILVGIFVLVLNFLHASEDSLDTGIYYEGVFVSKKETLIAVEIWNSKVNRDNSYEKDVRLILYDNFQKCLDDYLSGKISTIIMNPYKYYLNKEKLDKTSGREWVFTRSKNVFSPFYLIKNRGSTSDLKKMKNVEVLYKEDSAKNWAELYFYKSGIKNVKFKRVSKEKKLIFSAFFKNVYTVVKKELYDSMLELNPQIAKKIDIIGRSKAIFPIAIGLDRKDAYSKYKEVYEHIQKDVNDENVEFETVKYVNIKGIVTVSKKDLKPLDNFYREYFSIR